MKLETFFEKFELFVDAPNAVVKMRELILTLAVQGKLVPKDPKDEPATKLLERIQKTKECLINEHLIRKQKASEGGAQPNLSKVKIVAFPFPLSPFAEQNRIVAKVDQLMALVDELEAQLATSRSSSTNLLSAIVAELTGTPYNPKVFTPTHSGAGRRGRPPKA